MLRQTDLPTSFSRRQWIGAGIACAIVLFLSLYNLTQFPQTWFDEGSHLHVPKTLVRFGVYADYSSEGFRYFGPTIGVGTMVILPMLLLGCILTPVAKIHRLG